MIAGLISKLPEGRTLFQPTTAIATFFGAGLLPIAPGTWGSAAALPFGWLIAFIGGWKLLFGAALVVGVIGWWASATYVKKTGREDPSEIVIDEVAAQWLALCAVPMTLTGYALGFLVFRIFDTLKPWPASWADKEVDGGAGVMLDDVIAGLYALVTLLLFRVAGAF